MVTPKKGFSEGRKIKTNYFLAVAGVGTIVWSCLFGLKKISNNFYNKFEMKEIERIEYQNKIDSTYNSILQENVDDTTFVNLLNKYTPLREKEKVVLQNKLERDLK
jgi:hypothetical protein